MNEVIKRKLCVLSLESRRALSYENLSAISAKLASFGYYPDKVEKVGFDSSEEIVRALKEGKNNFGTAIILCPKRMEDTVKEFLGKLYGGTFDALGVLWAGMDTAVVLVYDGENRLKDQDLKNLLDGKYGVRYDRSYIKTVGAPAQLIESVLKKAKGLCAAEANGGDIFFNVKESYGDCRIEAVYSSSTPKMLLDDVVREVVGGLKEYIYALEDISLAEQIYRLLQLRRLKMSVAESFTGGGICQRLVEVPGISEVFFEGMNTYSNDSKMGRLGVKELTLKQNGAVSAETAYEMAEGLLKTGNCDVAVSTTGIAGPKSDNTAKPVGLAYIGVGVGDDIAVYKFNFTGDRETITKTAINQALFLTYKSLK